MDYSFQSVHAYDLNQAHASTPPALGPKKLSRQYVCMSQTVVCTQYAAVQHAVAGFYGACRSSRARLHASLGDTPFTPRAGATRIAAVKSQSDPHEAEATILSERTQRSD
jgi:hypothetical protein